MIGGTLLAGGSGTVVGALIGALFLGILKDGLILQGVNAELPALLSRPRDPHRDDASTSTSSARAGGISAVADASLTEHDVGRAAALGAGRRAARRTHRQALRPGDRAARRQPAPEKGRGARPARRQRRGQVDADQDHLPAFRSRTRARCSCTGSPIEPKSVDDARSKGIDTVYQDLALIDELSVYHNLFLRRERVLPPAAVAGEQADEARSARGARRDRDQHPPHRRGRGAPVGRPAPGDRGRADGQLRRRTSSCWTSRSRRWAPREGARSSTSWRA